MSETPPFQTFNAYRYQDGRWRDSSFDLAAEVPIALVYNGISHAVMMATPRDLEDFALGFSLTEGIIQAAAEILDVEIAPVCNGIEVRMTLTQRRLAGLKDHRRSMTGRTGCGLCGTESLNAAIRPQTPIVSDAIVQPAQLFQGLAALDNAQDLRKATRAAHAAGWMTSQGLELSREDVGRHNALDKVIGAGLKAGLVPAQGFMLVSSRCSVEMVQKTVAIGVPILAAVASPTQLAVELADQWGLTLVTSLRPDSFNVLTHAGRVFASPGLPAVPDAGHQNLVRR